MTGLPTPTKRSLLPTGASPKTSSPTSATTGGGGASPTSSKLVAPSLASPSRLAGLSRPGLRSQRSQIAMSSAAAAQASSAVPTPPATATAAQASLPPRARSPLTTIAAPTAIKTPRRSFAPSASTTEVPTLRSSVSSAALNKPYEAATVASRARGRESTSAATTGADARGGLEIGDSVTFVSDGETLQGVVRFVGEITGKPGRVFAGLELCGSSVGKGKNDGTVNGEQYFATEPLNGIFCKPETLTIVSDGPAMEATARPQSAMSHRSGRTSAMGGGGGGGDASGRASALSVRRGVTPEAGRSSSRAGMASSATTTPGKARPSSRASQAAGMPRPASTTPHSRRSSTAAAAVAPGASRPASAMSFASSTSSRPGSRLAPRKSVADMALDEQARRRAKTSAELAAQAEARVQPGSRAARFIGAAAADLVARRSGVGAATGAPTGPGSMPPIAGGGVGARAGSPLKDTLMRGRTSPGAPLSGGLPAPRAGRSSIGGPPITPLGGSTPRAAKGRASGIAAPSSSSGGVAPPPPSTNGANLFTATSRSSAAFDMGPPASPGKVKTPDAATATATATDELRKGARSASSLSTHSTSAAELPRTPSRAGAVLASRALGGGGGGEEGDATRPGHVRARDSVHLLLEEMDLTPRRPASSLQAGTNGASTPSGRHSRGVSEGGQSNYSTSGISVNAIALGDDVVPVALYEEATSECARLREHVALLERAAVEAARAAAQEKDVVALEAAREARREMDEERTTEKADEARRKREFEEREKIARERSAAAHKDELEVVRKEAQAKVESCESRLKESEALLSKLKATIGSSGERESEALRAKEAEIAQLKATLERTETEREAERERLKAENKNLRAIGDEMGEEYMQQREELNAQVTELQAAARHLYALVAKLETERDEALAKLAQATARSASSTDGVDSSAAAIDLETTREQLAHLQEKLAASEDAMEEVQLQLQQEREAALKRKERVAETEAKLKEDVRKAKSEVARLTQQKADAGERVEELHDALAASKAALENERAELEALRAEAHGISGSGESDERAAAEKARLESEIDRLSSLLEGARSGKREISKQVDGLKAELVELATALHEAQGAQRTAEAERSAADARLLQLSQSAAGGEHNAVISGLRHSIEVKTKEAELLRRSGHALPDQVARAHDEHSRAIAAKDEELRHLRNSLDTARMSARSSLTAPPRSSREFGVGGISGFSTSPTLESPSSVSSTGIFPSNVSPSPHASRRVSTASNTSKRSRTSTGSTAIPEHEMAGLRHIVGTLTEEVSTYKLRNRELSAELEDLKTELDVTRERAKTLDATLENLSAQLSSTDAGAQLVSLRRELVERTASLEKRVRDAEAAREEAQTALRETRAAKEAECRGLQLEIADLEALCESSVYRRDEQEALREELERKVAKLQRQLERNGAANVEQQHHTPTFVEKEIPPLPSPPKIVKDEGDDRPFCDDCEEYGHTLENCTIFF